jgi:hypothetical protein
VFALLMTTSVLSSTGGVVDSFLAGERARRRRPPVRVIPAVTGSAAALTFGGTY